MKNINYATTKVCKRGDFFGTRAAEVLLVLFFGGTVYCSAEMLWRGRTHISMALCGALCFFVLYRLEELPRFRSLHFQNFHFTGTFHPPPGAAVITAAEFVTGCAVNLWLGLGVWDYSGVPFSFLGQICLPFSALWFLLCLAAYPVCDALRRFVFGRR